MEKDPEAAPAASTVPAEQTDGINYTIKDLQTKTMKNLQEILRAAGFKLSGKKEELIERIMTLNSTPQNSRKRVAEEKLVSETEPPSKKLKLEGVAAPVPTTKSETAPTPVPVAQEIAEPEPVPSVLLNLPFTTTSDFKYFPDGTWKNLLADTFKQPFFAEVMNFVNEERCKQEVYPPSKDVWSAFEYTPFESVRVVIIGQDPYFNAGQAHGLCFSVREGVTVPPSLNRIYKEIASSVPGFKMPKHGYLEKWAKQGVFMLNATLTVQAGKPNSHQKCGWQKFTDAVVKILNDKKKDVIYLLWGGFAQKKCKVVDDSCNHILAAPHPSPMGGPGFNGCGHFKKVNEILSRLNQPLIDWQV